MNDSKKIINIFLRYIVILLIGINLSLIYLILTPLTLYPVYFLLSLFYSVSLIGTTLTIGISKIHLVEACIAGAAYYLLLILNLSVSMNYKKRIYSLLYSFALFLIINLVRIFVLSVLFLKNSLFFEFTHLLFWYSLSIIFVIVIWFSEVRLFKISNIPVYSDLKKILKLKT